eukprot:scaffold625_cov420-Prasinococcus_capsulatus_cf.AAC.21
MLAQTLVMNHGQYTMVINQQEKHVTAIRVRDHEKFTEELAVLLLGRLADTMPIMPRMIVWEVAMSKLRKYDLLSLAKLMADYGYRIKPRSTCAKTSIRAPTNRSESLIPGTKRLFMLAQHVEEYPRVHT